MNRYDQILNGIKETIQAEVAQKTYQGKKRSELKDGDFLFPETRSFPIVSPADVPDAISNFGRMSGNMSYDVFIKKLYDMAKRKGPEFVAALPKATKDKLGINSPQTACDMYVMPKEDSQPVVELKSEDYDEYTEDEYETDDDLSLVSEDEEMNGDNNEMTEYKQDFYEMSVGSIKSIMTHAYNILKSLDNPDIKNNLTESWLQGKIAVTEDYMITIHNFVMFGRSETDTEGSEKKN
jgi:hypothetical protein